MPSPSQDQQETIGAAPFVFAGLSFIPGLGVFFGIVAIVWGLVSEKRGRKKAAVIGAAGILFSVILYSTFFYYAFGQRGGVYDGLRAQLAQSTLNSLVPAIEFYKIQNGKYPDSLEALQAAQPRNSLLFLVDPSTTGFGAQKRLFFYQRVGEDHYYLRSVGVDGLPFTSDDIVPQISPSANSKIGLLINRRD